MAENTRGQNTDGPRGREGKNDAIDHQRSNMRNERQVSSRSMDDAGPRSLTSNRNSRGSSIFTRRNLMSTDYDGHLSDE